MNYNLTVEQIAELWDGYMQGQSVSQLARRFGKRQASMYQRIQASGGIRPTIPKRASRHLTLEDREEISRGLAAGRSLRQIAVDLGRAPSTIAREIEANGASLRGGTCLRRGAGRRRCGVTAARRRSGRIRA